MAIDHTVASAPSWGLGVALAVVVAACSTGSGAEGASSSGVGDLLDRSKGAAGAYTGGPPYPGPCVKIGDKRDDGQPEWIMRRVYNADGEVVREVYDHGADGAADAVFRYTYESGRLVERTKDAEPDGRPDEIRRFSYDDRGNRTKIVIDMRADNTPEKRISFEYDEAGRQTKKIVDYGADGAADGIWTYTYKNDRVIREEWDQDGDGTIDETVRYTYDEEGQLRREELYSGDQSVPAKVVEYERNGDGNVLE
ncbi:MAG: hypothetical protein ABEN55_01400, partial [Bradymonadaceae bacterium]